MCNQNGSNGEWKQIHAAHLCQATFLSELVIISNLRMQVVARSQSALKQTDTRTQNGKQQQQEICVPQRNAQNQTRDFPVPLFDFVKMVPRKGQGTGSKK